MCSGTQEHRGAPRPGTTRQSPSGLPRAPAGGEEAGPAQGLQDAPNFIQDARAHSVVIIPG